VAEILDNPTKYNGVKTLDPLEPDYGGWRSVGKILLEGTPRLNSFAHGQRVYKLLKQTSLVELVQGKTAEAAKETIRLLKNTPDMFDYGTELARVSRGKIDQLNRDTFAHWLGDHVQYWAWKKDKHGNPEQVLQDPPVPLLNQVIAINAGRELKPLKAVITAPAMTADGRVLMNGGYDADSQLYVAWERSANFVQIPEHVTREEALEALEYLMHPFRGFKLASPLDRGVLLAGLLTAIQRPALDTAPAIAIDAPTFGSGKTLLCECIAVLGTGQRPAVNTFSTGQYGEEENRKKLTAALSGGEQCILLDNVIGSFHSAAYAAFMTASTYTDRILGKSEMAVFPNRALLLISGNNMNVTADLCHRVLVCRIDTGMPNPAGRKFDFDPLEEIENNRFQLVAAGLTLIRGYLQSEEAANGGAVSGSTASYGQWDRIVRQTCAWVAKQRKSEYTDPGEFFKQAIEHDPTNEELFALHEALVKVFVEGPTFRANQIYPGLTDERRGEVFKELNLPHSDKRDEAAKLLLDMLSSMVVGKLSTASVGKILGYRVGKVLHGRRIVKRAGKYTLFKVERLSNV